MISWMNFTLMTSSRLSTALSAADGRSNISNHSYTCQIVSTQDWAANADNTLLMQLDVEGNKVMLAFVIQHCDVSPAG